MKKLTALLLALIMVLSLVACGNSTTPAATEAPKTDAPAATEAPAAPAGDPASDGDASNDPAVTLVYAEVNPLDTIVGQTATYFAE